MSLNNARKQSLTAAQEPQYNVFIAHNYELFKKNKENANSNDLRIKKLLDRNRTVSRRHQRKQIHQDQAFYNAQHQFIP